MNNAEIIKQLQDELEQTKLELNLTKEHLKKYTNNNCVFVSFFFPVGVTTILLREDKYVKA